MTEEIIIPEEIPSAPKDPRSMFHDEYIALVKRYGLAIQAFPVGMINEKGEFEYRSFEYRIVKVNNQTS